MNIMKAAPEQMFKNQKVTSEQMFRNQLEADSINKKVNNGKGYKNEMGKDSFLKLLITELKYQDPTRPMEDREFISQMAQFSALEQMTNMNKEITSMVRSSRSAEGFSLLGKYVDALNPVTNRRVSGIISSIEYRDNEQVLKVGKEEVSINDIHAVHNTEAMPESSGVVQSLQLNSGSGSKRNTDVVQEK